MASTSPPSVPPWATLASGGASGLASCLLLQPMDFLKTRMQQEASAERQSTKQASGSSSIPATTKPRGGPSRRTKRLIDTTKSVLREDGWRGLWRGTVPTVARNVPGVAMYFYSVSEIRAIVAKAAIPYLSLSPSTSTLSTNFTTLPSSSSKSSTLARLTVLGNLVSGAVARVAVGFLLSPVTVVKARFESSHFSKDAYPSLSRALTQIYQVEGVKGLFRGFSATAMRDAPYAGIYLASYEKSKDALGKWERVGGRGSGSTLVIGFSGEYEEEHGKKRDSRQHLLNLLLFPSLAWSGMFAGALATLITHPFDIIKTRMQTSPVVIDRLTRPTSMIATASEIVRMDGWGAYLDGLGLRCARKAASSAIGWTIFEAGRRLWVGKEMQRRERRELAFTQGGSG